MDRNIFDTGWKHQSDELRLATMVMGSQRGRGNGKIVFDCLMSIGIKQLHQLCYRRFCWVNR